MYGFNSKKLLRNLEQSHETPEPLVSRFFEKDFVVPNAKGICHRVISDFFEMIF